MRLLISEYISGGGVSNHPLPESLKQEGLLMLKSVLTDCMQINDLELVTTLDSRIGFNIEGVEIIQFDESKDYIDFLSLLAKQCDITWIIAPESDNTLGLIIERLSDEKIRLVNCDAESIAICSDKIETANHLLNNGLPTIKNLSKNELSSFIDKVVVKDRFGAGCEGLKIYPLGRDVLNDLNDFDSYVVQPCMQGDHLSLSLLCLQGQAKILSVNTQKFIGDNEPKLIECAVNVIPDTEEFLNMANRIAESLPGLLAYVGVDLIRSDKVNFIVDINPRLTSSYVGLSKVLSQNPAQLCLDATLNKMLPIKIERKNTIAEVCLGQLRVS